MQRLSVSEFVKRCRDITDTDELWCEALSFFRSRDVTSVSYYRDDGKIAAAARQAAARDQIPGTWKSYLDENELWDVDPLPRIAAVISRPFSWAEIDGLVELTKVERDYLAELRRFGFGKGVAVPVFGPNLRNALVAFGFGSTAPGLDHADIIDLQCAAQIAHLIFCDLRGNQTVNGARLSPRELEILRWIARGKSNSVIADILGISRHTVDTIMRRMFEKLDVHDRTTAAIRGLKTGLLYHRGSEVL